MIEERESAALEAYLGTDNATLATSRIAVVEVARATALANPSAEVREETERLLESCLLVEVSASLLREAAGLASRDVRTLDAIHLATARHVEPDEVLVYDSRLREAAAEIGLAVASPGEH